ncbi:MAG: hypothetical protein AB8B50_15915 [Pirellulaceae bacterium]
MEKEYGKWVEVEFDCLPLRSVSRFDVPDDASPKLARKLLRIRDAVEKHGTHNTYFLHNSKCTFRLTNDEAQGMLSYTFDGVLMTDSQDLKSKGCELNIELEKETCAWINQAVVDWFAETVQRTVLVEFDRYIEAGDLGKTLQRMKEAEQAAEESGGFVGMYL